MDPNTPYPNQQTQNDKDVIDTLRLQVEKLKYEKVELENHLEQEQERFLNNLNKSSGWTTPQSPVGMNSYDSIFYNSTLAESLKAEINQLRSQKATVEKELISTQLQSQIFKKELIELRKRLNIPIDDLLALPEIFSTTSRRRSQTVSSLSPETRSKRSQSVSFSAVPVPYISQPSPTRILSNALPLNRRHTTKYYHASMVKSTNNDIFSNAMNQHAMTE
ncbi:hypothetical protein BB558_003429 [Smittium angustum]|uniref:Uncharacterized protein n=1 Tax=Smittium angustum TaxID=133377 RepID=A0A2U1J607_SMIAN|nr:hypothetical protein BB558_003429 [Smittium angustum]